MHINKNNIRRKQKNVWANFHNIIQVELVLFFLFEFIKEKFPFLCWQLFSICFFIFKLGETLIVEMSIISFVHDFYFSYVIYLIISMNNNAIHFNRTLTKAQKKKKFSHYRANLGSKEKNLKRSDVSNDSHSHPKIHKIW